MVEPGLAPRSRRTQLAVRVVRRALAGKATLRVDAPRRGVAGVAALLALVHVCNRGVGVEESTVSCKRSSPTPGQAAASPMQMAPRSGSAESTSLKAVRKPGLQRQ